MTLYGYVWKTVNCVDPFELPVWRDLGMNFDTWFDQASVDDIKNNMSDYQMENTIKVKPAHIFIVS
jgi:hypothetical protein